MVMKQHQLIMIMSAHHRLSITASSDDTDLVTDVH